MTGEKIESQEAAVEESESDEDNLDEEEFFTPGSQSLLEARQWITTYSLKGYTHINMIFIFYTSLKK